MKTNKIIKMKFYLTMVAVMFVASVLAQDVSLIINGKKIGERTITDSPSVIDVKKSRYKNITTATVIIKQSTRNNVFKRIIEITDANETILYTINESSSKPGWYKINLTSMRVKLLKQEVIKVYLAENPANDMMKVRSSRKLLAELHLK